MVYCFSCSYFTCMDAFHGGEVGQDPGICAAAVGRSEFDATSQLQVINEVKIPPITQEVKQRGMSMSLSTLMCRKAAGAGEKWKAAGGAVIWELRETFHHWLPLY